MYLTAAKPPHEALFHRVKFITFSAILVQSPDASCPETSNFPDAVSLIAFDKRSRAFRF